MRFSNQVTLVVSAILEEAMPVWSVHPHRVPLYHTSLSDSSVRLMRHIEPYCREKDRELTHDPIIRTLHRLRVHTSRQAQELILHRKARHLHRILCYPACSPADAVGDVEVLLVADIGGRGRSGELGVALGC